jgi:citrate synthase
MLGSHAWRRGYVNTSAVKSAISYIDGDKGILRYRGYPIEQLAERSNFTEVHSLPGLWSCERDHQIHTAFSFILVQPAIAQEVGRGMVNR